MEKFLVTINHKGQYGYIEYDLATKELVVNHDDQAVVEKVTKFLSAPVELNIPMGETIRNFEHVTVEPLANLDSLEKTLGVLWVNTEVRVEWSIPPKMMETL